ncbi:adenosine deaminase [Clostridium sp. YIM B02551]|uniref:adenosine deaminase n=1 Tax=Clostridium sp. YIM B02551 TaxID=2910679 RepID=UPI001EECCE11|nr:adenosine deaminase [Clostridium sp. YIM B02551]
MNVIEDIKRIPKIELHLHLDGSTRKETIWELLNALGENPFSSYEELNNILSIDGKCESLKEYLEAFYFPIKVMQTKEALTRVSEELVEDLAKEGVIYSEIRFAPYFHQEKGLSIEEVIEAVLKGLSKGERKYKVKSRLIICAMRGFPIEKNIDLVKRAAAFLNKGVVALDLAGNEHDFPPEESKEVFKLAKDLGFHLTVHAGETGKEENIEKAINILGAERIGHGVFAYKNPNILKLIKEKGVFLEMCPTSNLNTNAIKSLLEHPIKTYYGNGLKVTLNTDNRTVSNVSLSIEINNIIDKLGLSFEDFEIITYYAVEAAFCSIEDKEWLKNKVENYYNK